MGPTIADVPRALGFHPLRDLGGVSRGALSLGTVPLAILLARTLRELAPQLVRAASKLVAELANFFSCAAGSLGAGGIQTHLLLL